jgi:hypothetical protein
MRMTPVVLAPQQAGGRGAGGFGGGGRGGRGGGAAIPTFGGTVAANPGDYNIVVKAAGKTFTKNTYILEDVWFDKKF